MAIGDLLAIIGTIALFILLALVVKGVEKL